VSYCIRAVVLEGAKEEIRNEIENIEKIAIITKFVIKIKLKLKLKLILLTA